MNQGVVGQSPCFYFPCQCFQLGSGISCKVYNGIFNADGQFRSHQGAALSTNKLCAAKEIEPNHAQTRYAKREIDILKSLQHQNIVPLLDVRPKSDGKIVMYMERCDGNLENLIRKPENYTGLSPQLLLSLLSQYTDGFQYLQRRGIAHRDIKPLNILYNVNPSPPIRFGRRDDYTFKLADFGVARQAQNDELLNSLVGTPEFLSPEVVGRRYGPTADLWSTAVMFFNCIAGHLPFVARDFGARYNEYLFILSSQRKKDDIAAFSRSVNSAEFSSHLPSYCQLYGRLKEVLEKLLRQLLSSAQDKELKSDVEHSLLSGDYSQASMGHFEKFFKFVSLVTGELVTLLEHSH